MNVSQRVAWFSVVTVIMITWGAVFALFGLGILPIADPRVLLSWESALYGAIMIGWGTTLLLLGRIALRRRDPELTRPVLLGLGVWLAVEAVFSARYGVWFNVGVDAAVFLLFSVPLISGLRSAGGDGGPAA